MNKCLLDTHYKKIMCKVCSSAILTVSSFSQWLFSNLDSSIIFILPIFNSHCHLSAFLVWPCHSYLYGCYNPLSCLLISSPTLFHFPPARLSQIKSWMNQLFIHLHPSCFQKEYKADDNFKIVITDGTNKHERF